MVIDMQSGRYKAYPEYKDSGVEWLGDIPSHWELLRGKWRFKSLKEVNRNLQCMDRLALTMRGVIERSIESDDGLQPSAFTGYQIFEKDDLVFKLIDLENYKTSRVGLVFKKGIMSPAYIRLKPNKDVSSKFFYYFYFDLYLRGIYNQIGGQGVRSALNASDLLEIQICVPSRDEQVEIADFLDHETAKIDTLIEKQQRLIELLTEKRQAVISHAVTKGLNPNAPMKDSGIDWLGEIPEHWDVSLLKYKCDEITDGAHVSPDTENGKHFFISITDIKDGVINFNNALLTSSSSYKYLIKTGCMPFVGDILFSKDGTIGQTAITPKSPKFVVASSLIIIRPDKEKVASGYLELLLQSSLIKEQVEGFVKGAALRRLSIQNLLKVFGVFPPTIKEQLEIEDYVRRNLNNYKNLIDKAEQAIQLMQERRTALISAAVTGKIDVRDWVKPE